MLSWFSRVTLDDLDGFIIHKIVFFFWKKADGFVQKWEKPSVSVRLGLYTFSRNCVLEEKFRR
jgi:hypothetical protein